MAHMNLQPGSTIGPYTVVRYLGGGAFGTVYEVLNPQDPDNGPHRALKIVDTTRKSAQENKYLLQEAYLQESFNHEYIIRLYRQTWIGRTVLLELELGGESLKDILKRQPLSESQIKLWANHIAVAMGELARRHIAHRDLKPDNILIVGRSDDPTAVAKLCDFGFAREYEGLMESQLGTPLYMAPEIVKHQPYGPISDLWSLGLIFAEMAGIQVITAKTPVQLLLFAQDPQDITFNAPSFSYAFNTLIQGLLKKDQNSRMTHEQLLAHPFIQLPKVIILSPPANHEALLGGRLPHVIQHNVNPIVLGTMPTLGRIATILLSDTPALHHSIIVGRSKLSPDTPTTQVLTEILHDGLLIVDDNFCDLLLSSAEDVIPPPRAHTAEEYISYLQQFDALHNQQLLVNYVLDVLTNLVGASRNTNVTDLVTQWQSTRRGAEDQILHLKEVLEMCQKTILPSDISAIPNQTLAPYAASIKIPDAASFYQADNWFNKRAHLSNCLVRQTADYAAMYQKYSHLSEAQARQTADYTDITEAQAAWDAQLSAIGDEIIKAYNNTLSCYRDCLTFWETFSSVWQVVNSPDIFLAAISQATAEHEEFANSIKEQVRSVESVMNAVKGFYPKKLAQDILDNRVASENVLQEELSASGISLSFKPLPSVEVLTQTLGACFSGEQPVDSIRAVPVGSCLGLSNQPCARCLDLEKRIEVIQRVFKIQTGHDVPTAVHTYIKAKPLTVSSMPSSCSSTTCTSSLTSTLSQPSSSSPCSSFTSTCTTPSSNM
ncbi:serine/threonine-protein kinase fused [Pelomyxa schiedti]|nr:serine/threonine-protein kinase fused [Pelomyxa schiedti]